jgi:glyoxylase-like metal-dependent hydrolase (beta-lactamase superfamily II)
MSKLEVQVFAGREASVNAYIVQNQTHAVVIDTLRNRDEAAELASVVKKGGRKLQAILVTHGHPDHYIGVRTLKEAFPSARVLVASEAIKRDAIDFSKWMESVGWLEKQPQMKPRSSANPEGFDYERTIEVVEGSRLEIEGGSVLEIQTNYPATESAHMTTIFAPELNALFASDLCYRDVHAWAGQGVLREHIGNWIRVLGDLKARTKPGLKVYPGHGPVSDAAIFDQMRVYLDDLTSAVDSEETDLAAIERMKRLYPAHAQADFLLAHSVAFHGPDARKNR